MTNYIEVKCDTCGVYMHSLMPGVAYPKQETTCGLCKEPPDPAPTGPMPSHDEIVALAIANGFDNEDESGVGGDSSLDRSVCCGEYACGNEVIRFAHALLAKYQTAEAAETARLREALQGLYDEYCAVKHDGWDFPGNPWTPERDKDEVALAARDALQGGPNA